MGGASSICSSNSGEVARGDPKVEEPQGRVHEMPVPYEERRPSKINVTDVAAVQEVLVTPRREKALYSGVVATPKGEQVHIYKYFCPICTLYFEDILRSQCCGHYSCIECTQQYLIVKGCKADTIHDVLRANDPNIPCLSCNTTGFRPKLVHHEDVIRDYSRNDDADSSYVGSTPGTVLYSPVKVGDSYENLKRKMQPFPDVKQQLFFGDESAADVGMLNSCTTIEECSAGIDSVVATDANAAGPECDSPPMATDVRSSNNPLSRDGSTVANAIDSNMPGVSLADSTAGAAPAEEIDFEERKSTHEILASTDELHSPTVVTSMMIPQQ